MERLDMLHYTTAHARTLLLAYRHQEEFLNNAPDNLADVDQYIVHQAWNRLVAWTGLSVDGKSKRSKGADVNYEAVSLLDKIMFDESSRAGVAGNHQWGLDVGPHEMGWNPQFTGPNVTVGKRREGNDDEEVLKGKGYNHEAEEVERKKAKLTEPSHKQQKRKAKDSNMVKAVKKRKKQ
ncbi:hypothetical protein GG344DRAFT_83111 [Lentinula edodes]|nr:hypothetical protein GG344DRAFT_83111 [Lentinula edodes]